MKNPKQHSALIITIAGIGAVVAIAIGALAFTGKSNNSVATINVTPPPTTTTSTYKDGTYTATGSYNSPGGTEAINVSLTLKNDIVRDATVVSEATDRQSLQYQNRFISGYKQYVIGKDISSLSLSKVSGSSLTTRGFDSAISIIRTEAQA